MHSPCPLTLGVAETRLNLDPVGAHALSSSTALAPPPRPTPLQQPWSPPTWQQAPSPTLALCQSVPRRPAVQRSAAAPIWSPLCFPDPPRNDRDRACVCVAVNTFAQGPSRAGAGLITVQRQGPFTAVLHHHCTCFMDGNTEAHVAVSPGPSHADTAEPGLTAGNLAARALNDHTSVPSRRLFSLSHPNLVGVGRLMWRREGVTRDLSEATRILVLGFELRLQSPHASVQ